jgi:hypothetical protein
MSIYRSTSSGLILMMVTIDVRLARAYPFISNAGRRVHLAMLAFIEMIKTGTTTFCEAGIRCTRTVTEASAGLRGLGRWTWDLFAEREHEADNGSGRGKMKK